jgi:hypothetical protein
MSYCSFATAHATCADIYPLGATAIFGYQGGDSGGSGDKGIVHISFSTASMSGASTGQLMMMAMTHHRTHLLYPDPPPDGSAPVVIDDLRGGLTPVMGSDWYLGYDLPDIGWEAPHGVSDPAMRAAVITALKADAAGWQGRFPAADPYFGSSDLAALGRMAVIADELAATSPGGDTGEEAAELRSVAASLRALLEPHLNGRLVTNPLVEASLVYDMTWGGAITYHDASTHTSAYFGNSVYNDHHYHWGYLLYAAAALGKDSPAWLAVRRDSLLALVRDFANPRRDDPWFPLARHMDWWGGHSWAGGIPALADSKNQVGGG